MPAGSGGRKPWTVSTGCSAQARTTPRPVLAASAVRGAGRAGRPGPRPILSAIIRRPPPWTARSPPLGLAGDGSRSDGPMTPPWLTRMRASSDNSQVLLGLARCRYALAEVDEARQLLDELLRRQPRHPDALLEPAGWSARRPAGRGGDVAAPGCRRGSSRRDGRPALPLRVSGGRAEGHRGAPLPRPPAAQRGRGGARSAGARCRPTARRGTWPCAMPWPAS